MKRLLQITGILAIAALLIGGVLEVRIHPDRLAQVPARVTAIVTDKATQESMKVRFTNIKRSAEQWIIKDDAKKMELAIAYINTDATKTSQLISEQQGNPATVVPQAELLVASIERAAELAGSIPADQLAEASSDTKNAFQNAQAALTELQQTQAEYEALQQRFATVTDELQQHIGQLSTEEGEVAGTSDNGAEE